ncbi:MAG: hypothetical protein DRH04_04525 [Deltaproteobacteria bacterium]|nr:MAG: hypothetical protein DRH04_04525 [Deltaproteobacteria bacterium]
MKWLPYAMLGLVSAIFLGLALLGPLSTETLYWVQPLMIILNLLLIVFALMMARKPILSFFSKIPKKFWIAILLIFLMGFSYRLFIPPKHHKIYYDEDIYLDIAHNIANQDKACLCDYGSRDYCYECIDNKQPMGMPTFYSLIMMKFKPFGFLNEFSIFCINIFISSLAIIGLFLLASALTKNKLIALLAALGLAINPTHVRWSVSTSQDAFFVTFLLATMFVFFLSLKQKQKGLTLAAFLLASYTIQIRTEGFLILPIMGIIYLLYQSKPWVTLGTKEMVIAVSLLLLFTAPTMLHILNNKQDSWGAPEGKKLSLDYMEGNIKANVGYFFDNTRFPIIFSVLALIGILLGLFRYTKATLSLLFWFFSFFLLYAVFYAGSFSYGMDVRFVLSMLPVVFILSGIGCFGLWDWFWNKAKPVFKDKLYAYKLLKNSLLVVIFMGLTLATIIPFHQAVSTFGEQASDAKLMHELATKFVPSTDKNCLFLSQVSSMFRNLGRSSIQMHRFRWGDKREELLSNYDCIYLYWGYWCASSEPHRKEQCQPLLDEFDFEKKASIKHYDKEFAFYYLNRE